MAFSFGVLAKHKVTGAILYGPPGTGKSLLARAVAKASGFNMICITTAEVWQKCHGDDQRMVQAIFRLARKMHPCIIFIDEADALFGQRKQGERRHIKGMINQFLIEWDGLSTDKTAPFVLLATNRPTDLDPAVIRRAPEQIYMGKPNLEQRAGIIEILLKGEVLGPNVSPHWLAQRTPGYTGSDLKNVCVTAATICVGQQREDRRDRILQQSHFSEALRNMRASRVKKRDEEEYNAFGGKVENNFGAAGSHGQGDEDDD
jgi:SpoVK/Ycf46/Vps4 family AAA+-type ATPase